MLFKVGIADPYPVRLLHPVIYPGCRDWREYYRNNKLNLPDPYYNGGIWPLVGGFCDVRLCPSRRARWASAGAGRAGVEAGRKTMDEQLRILVVCTGNSARSQIAEGLFRHLGGERVQVFSAGSEPSGEVHPLAVRAMAEIGLDISAHRPKSVIDFLGQPFDYVIAVCSHAAQSCPVFPGPATRLNWFYDDPAAVEGDEMERLAAFRAVRDDLRERIAQWLADQSKRQKL